MCQFISWKSYNGKNYFLTSADLRTKEGRKLLKLEYKDDICGHGAIEHYYPELKGKGENKECSDFSSPDNFPKDIVKAIKQGKFCGIGINLDILNEIGKKKYNKIKQPALAEYNKIEQPAWAEYNKIEQSALAEYNKIEQSALAEYNKIKQPALAEYNKIKQPALAEYNKIEQPALAEYNKIEQSALAEYNKIEQSALAEYNKIEQSALAEYNKIEQPALAEYNKIEQPAWAEYNKIKQPALAEYNKIEQSAFGILPNNQNIGIELGDNMPENKPLPIGCIMKFCDICLDITNHKYIGDGEYVCMEHPSIKQNEEENGERRYL